MRATGNTASRQWNGKNMCLGWFFHVTTVKLYRVYITFTAETFLTVVAFHRAMATDP